MWRILEYYVLSEYFYDGIIIPRRGSLYCVQEYRGE